MKMFTGNPLEGSWTDEDGNMDLKIGRNGQMTVILPASGDGEETQVPMTYTLSKESKTISIQEDDNKIQEIAEKIKWSVYRRDVKECSAVDRNDI